MTSLFNPKIVVSAIADSFRKLDPRTLARNPIMSVVVIVAVLTTISFLRDLARDLVTGGSEIVRAHAWLSGQIAAWLWFSVLFANFAVAAAERRGKAQAATLRKARAETMAKVLGAAQSRETKAVPAMQLKPGQLVLVEPDDLIPSDGEVIDGVASVDESAITGESAPVIRAGGGDRSAVTGGTRVLSGRIVVKITAASSTRS